MKTTKTNEAISHQPSAKHTPGPWNFQKNGECELRPELIYSESKILGFGVAHTIPVYTEEMRLANARLIAAAPELLAALEKICSREMTAWNGHVKGILFEDICAAKTAIAKAKGK